MPKENSLITAYILDGKGFGRQIGWDEIASWTPDQGVLWVHLNFSKKKSQAWLRQKSGLDKVTTHAMISEESRPRSVIASNGLLVFLRGLNLNPGQEPEDMVSIRTWVEKDRIITTRRRHLLSVDDIRASLDSGIGPKTSVEFLHKLNNRLIDRMSDFIESIEDQVDSLDQELITAESHLLRPKIADVRRESIMIRRYLAPQREALTRLYLDEASLLDSMDRVYLREAADRIVRYIEDLDAARERATVSQEELSSRLSEQLDRRMYALSVVAVIFLPLTFITGLFGMNLGGIPGSTYKWAFTISCVALTALFLIMLFFFHKKKWI